MAYPLVALLLLTLWHFKTWRDRYNFLDIKSPLDGKSPNFNFSQTIKKLMSNRWKFHHCIHATLFQHLLEYSSNDLNLPQFHLSQLPSTRSINVIIGCAYLPCPDLLRPLFMFWHNCFNKLWAKMHRILYTSAVLYSECSHLNFSLKSKGAEESPSEN